MAKKVEVSTATIQRWTKAEHFPTPMRFGIGKNSRMEWWESKVDEWIAVKEGRV